MYSIKSKFLTLALTRKEGLTKHQAFISFWHCTTINSLHVPFENKSYKETLTCFLSTVGQKFLKLLPLLVRALFNTRKVTLPKRQDLISNGRTWSGCCRWPSGTISSVDLGQILTTECSPWSWEIWMMEGPDNNMEFYKVAVVLK